MLLTPGKPQVISRLKKSFAEQLNRSPAKAKRFLDGFDEKNPSSPAQGTQKKTAPLSWEAAMHTQNVPPQGVVINANMDYQCCTEAPILLVWWRRCSFLVLWTLNVSDGRSLWMFLGSLGPGLILDEFPSAFRVPVTFCLL